MMDFGPIEDIEIKQTLASMAQLVHDYVLELRNQGFTRREAIRIAIGWQHAILTFRTDTAE